MEETEMEPGEVRIGTMGVCSSYVNPATPPAQAEHFGSPRFDSSQGSFSKKKKKGKVNQQFSPEKDTTAPSVSKCYVFKSRLQEYAQKAGLTIPVYETIKEGPSHEPFFRSTVTVNEVRYDSLPGFFNRKAAEQSAAEVALTELSKSADVKFGIATPVHETGLCKNLLQEYAQKMNYAVPLYECIKEEKQGRMPMYSCVVEIGGTRYIGASASTKKEAEIKAARTALLAIQSAPSASEDTGNSVYTVIPEKKRVPDLGISTQETAAALKPKKNRFKKQQQRKKMRALKKHSAPQGMIAGGMEVNLQGLTSVQPVVIDAPGSQHNINPCLDFSMPVQNEVEVGVTDDLISQEEAVDASAQEMIGSRSMEVLSFQGTNSQLEPVGMVKSISSTGFCGGTVENALVQCNENFHKDGLEGEVYGHAAVELGGAEAGITDVVSSQEKAVDGTEVNMVDVAATGSSVPTLPCSQGTDSGSSPMETRTENSNTGGYNGNPENATVPSEALCEDGKSVTMDVHP